MSLKWSRSTHPLQGRKKQLLLKSRELNLHRQLSHTSKKPHKYEHRLTFLTFSIHLPLCSSIHLDIDLSTGIFSLLTLNIEFLFWVCLYAMAKLIYIRLEMSGFKDSLLDSLVVECWHRVRVVPGSIPSQRPRHTKDVIKMVQVVSLFSTQHWKGNTGSF